MKYYPIITSLHKKQILRNFVKYYNDNYVLKFPRIMHHKLVNFGSAPLIRTHGAEKGGKSIGRVGKAAKCMENSLAPDTSGACIALHAR